MSQVEGLQLTLDALEAEGKQSVVPEAVIALAKGLAAELDGDASDSRGRAALWREYRAAVTAVLEAADGASDDDTAAFLVQIRTPSRG